MVIYSLCDDMFETNNWKRFEDFVNRVRVN